MPLGSIAQYKDTDEVPMKTKLKPTMQQYYQHDFLSIHCYCNTVAQGTAQLCSVALARGRLSKYSNLLHFTPNCHSYYSLSHKKYL